MFITPIQPMESILLQNNTTEKPMTSENVSPFRDLVQTAFSNLTDTEKQANANTTALATGSIDDLHTLGIENTKAYLAERLVVEVRNRTLDAYSELMRINL